MNNNPFQNTRMSDIKTLADTLDIQAGEKVYRKLFSSIDLTSLNITDTDARIGEMCGMLNNFTYQFPDLTGVAAICVYPRFVPLVKSLLDAPDVKIASVGACFPSSQSFTAIKSAESKMAVDAGANEIDMVISVGDMLAGNTDFVSSEIAAIKKASGPAHLKVILESGLFDSPSVLYDAAMISMIEGADFIKTSTGKSAVSATPEAAWVMCSAIRDYNSHTGRKVGFKAAGGIATTKDATIYYSIVDRLLGKEWLTPSLFRIGASRLANNLLSDIEGREIKYFKA
jgi:deoxyribose-phosphate aldolase